jgi:hypothetical protein
MVFAQHTAVDFPVLLQAFAAGWISGVFAGHAFGVVAIAGMRDRTRAFDGLTAFGGCAERVVGFVVVIPAEGLSVEHVEGFVGEGFL